ncbi:MAG TPA: DUF4136 domain-containing protein [Telmatospirillum sp.]|nr:DUF4136 domain-containing protein [Telmatospirillum sp.]
MRRFLAGCSLILLLAACQPVLRADVTRFYSLPPPPTGQSFAIAPDAGQSGDLEFQRYALLMSNALQSKGFVLAAPQGAAADLVAVLHYGNIGSHTEIYSEPAPAWGRPGGWGWRGYPPEINSYTVYSLFVDLALFDGPAWRAGERRMLFQARALGDSGVRDVNSAMPSLVRALLSDFPGANGLTVRVSVPLDETP